MAEEQSNEQELVHIPTIEQAELTVEEEIQLIRTKYFLTEDDIDRLNDEAAKFAGPVTSHERAEEVRAALSRINKAVSIGEKNLDLIDRRRIDTNRLQMKMVQEIRARINEPVLLLKGPLVEWQKEQKRLAEEREAAIAAEREMRKNRLTELRFTFVPGPPEHRYEMNGLGWAVRDIIAADHEKWKAMEREAVLMFEDLERMEAEEAQRKADEQAAIDKAAAELAERERALTLRIVTYRQGVLRQQGLELRDGGWFHADVHLVDNSMLHAWTEEEFDAKVDDLVCYFTNLELKQNADAIEASRSAELLALGVDKDCHWGIYDLSQDVSLPLHGYEEGEWPLVINRVKEVIGRHQEREARLAEKMREAAEKQRLENERQALIQQRRQGMLLAGWVSDTTQGDAPIMTLTLKTGPLPPRTVAVNISEITEEEYLECIDDGNLELVRRSEEAEQQIREEAARKERERAEAAAAQAIEEEKNRQARLGDVEKWHEWVAAVKASAPKMESATGNHAIGRVIAGLDAMTPNLIQDLKK